MASESGTDTQQSNPPGTLEKFHLGLAADGMTCALVFVDEHHRSMACIASFADLNGFIVSLTRPAAEMTRRRSGLVRNDGPSTDEEVTAIDDSGIDDSVVDDDGQVVPIRMRPDVANEMTRNMLKTARIASAC